MIPLVGTCAYDKWVPSVRPFFNLRNRAEEREESEFERNIPPQNQCLAPTERGEKGGEDETLNEANKHLSREI